MSRCYNCGIEFTLKGDETKCPDCKKQVRFICHNCKKWFSVYDEVEKKKRLECKICGFFYCPNCGSCGPNCSKISWRKKIKDFLKKENPIELIINYIEEIKTSKEQKVCMRKVPISYAKNRIKSCWIKLRGYKVKNEEDRIAFEKRMEIVLDKNIGEVLTITNSRNFGSYGQEYRDIFNLCLCLGKLEKIKCRRIIDGEEIEYWGYRRVESSICPMLDTKDLILKQCPRKDCKIKDYPLSQKECCVPECRYKTGKNKGKFPKLKLKISTKDICQLNRRDFKKEEDGKSKPY